MQSADLHLICTLRGLTSVGKEAAQGENTLQIVHGIKWEKNTFEIEQVRLRADKTTTKLRPNVTVSPFLHQPISLCRAKESFFSLCLETICPGSSSKSRYTEGQTLPQLYCSKDEACVRLSKAVKEVYATESLRKWIDICRLATEQAVQPGF